MPLGTLARDEIFLTAAQSLFGTVLLLTLRFDLWKAFALLSLFLIQVFPTGLDPPLGIPVGDYYGQLRNDMGKHVPATGSTGPTNLPLAH